MFDSLMNEVECINKHLGTVGVLDAIMYIQAHEDEYKGTQCYREYLNFMRQGARMFAPAA